MWPFTQIREILAEGRLGRECLDEIIETIQKNHFKSWGGSIPELSEKAPCNVDAVNQLKALKKQGKMYTFEFELLNMGDNPDKNRRDKPNLTYLCDVCNTPRYHSELAEYNRQLAEYQLALDRFVQLGIVPRELTRDEAIKIIEPELELAVKKWQEEYKRWQSLSEEEKNRTVKVTCPSCNGKGIEEFGGYSEGGPFSRNCWRCDRGSVDGLANPQPIIESDEPKIERTLLEAEQKRKKAIDLLHHQHPELFALLPKTKPHYVSSLYVNIKEL